MMSVSCWPGMGPGGGYRPFGCSQGGYGTYVACDQSTFAMDVKHFISPSEEVIEEEEKVTFEQLLEPYQSLPKMTRKCHA